MLRLIPLEFEYIARSSLHLPAGKTTNILRGALGLELRRQSCPPVCTDSRTCPQKAACLYQQLFEGETGAPRPSGYQEPPRPFVLRCSPQDWLERTVAPGQRFVTSLHLFDQRPEILAALLAAYSHFGDTGLGPGRARLTLHQIRQPGRGVLLWTEAEPQFVQPPAAISLALDPVAGGAAPRRVKAEFLTPTEIKVHGEVTRDAAFAPLFARLHERIVFLRRHYSPATVQEHDDETLNAAKQIVTVSQSLRDAAGVTRYSTRTQQTHPLSGFTGEAVYEGDFTWLWPWLKASQWTGVGRQTVWGKGVIRWSEQQPTTRESARAIPPVA